MAVAAARKPAKPAPAAVPGWPADAIERRPTGSLRPYERNARVHSDAQVEQIAEAIRQWGWTMPLLVDEADEIIAGHGRLAAALKLGLPDVPVMVARGWSEAQKRAYVVADNKLALNASWDSGLLALELEDLKSVGFDLALTGFDIGELEKLLPVEATAPESFRAFDESIPTDHKCPKCGYVWSGGNGPSS